MLALRLPGFILTASSLSKVWGTYEWFACQRDTYCGKFQVLMQLIETLVRRSS